MYYYKLDELPDMHGVYQQQIKFPSGQNLHEVHGIGIHTAQYMFATLWELHLVPRLMSEG